MIYEILQIDRQSGDVIASRGIVPGSEAVAAEVWHDDEVLVLELVVVALEDVARSGEAV